MPEVNQQTVYRVADLEREVADLRKRLESGREDKTSVPAPVRWVRTWGESSPGGSGSGGTGRDYPLYVVGEPAVELPAVFLDGAPPDDLADDFVWTKRSAEPQTMVISPGGWIPETIELPVFMNTDRRWHVLRTPTLRAITNELILPEGSGKVKLRRGDTTFDIDACYDWEVYLDWMHSNQSVAYSTQVRVVLDWDVRRWSIYAVGC